MRVTMNDGRQMTGQMLAFDKVSQVLPALYHPPQLISILTRLAAYEPRPRRYRRISQSQARSKQTFRARRTRLRSSSNS